jgi:hypothetical protein
MIDVSEHRRGTFEYAAGINDNGQIVGSATFSSGYSHTALCTLGRDKDEGDHGTHHH